MSERPIHNPYLTPRRRDGLGFDYIQGDDWIEPTSNIIKALTFKRDTLTLHGRKAFRARKSSVEPAKEVLLLLAKYLSLQYPDDYALWGDFLAVTSSEEKFPIRKTAPLHPLYVAGRLVPDDLLILAKRKEQWVLTAASVCSPCNWLLGDYVGKSFDTILGSSLEDNPHLTATVEQTLDTLKPGHIAERKTWRICPSREPFLVGGAKKDAWRWSEGITAADAGSRLWVRVERQTLQKLPESGVALLTIRTTMDRLDTVAEFADLRLGLQKELGSLSEEQVSFMGLAPFAAALGDYLSDRS